MEKVAKYYTKKLTDDSGNCYYLSIYVYQYFLFWIVYPKEATAIDWMQIFTEDMFFCGNKVYFHRYGERRDIYLQAENFVLAELQRCGFVTNICPEVFYFILDEIYPMKNATSKFQVFSFEELINNLK